MNENQLHSHLKEHIRGDLFFDNMHRIVYSVDASIYELKPLGIIVPLDESDLITAVKIASQYGVSVTPRGAATGITGSCLGEGLIIDTSKYFTSVTTINIPEEYVICQPGVIQDQLNDMLASYGYRLGPDTSTGNRATLGGMLANNSAGARSLIFGSMRDHIIETKLVLENGDQMVCGPLSEEEYNKKLTLDNHEGHIYREMKRILTTYSHDILEHTPQIPRHVSGYNLLGVLKDPHHNLSKLIAGSEGTLGIITEMKLRIVKKLQHTGLCLIIINDLMTALKTIPFLLSFHPISLEMIDNNIISSAMKSPTVPKGIDWIDSNASAIFIAEFEGVSQNEVNEKLRHFCEEAQKKRVGYREVILTEKSSMNSVWEIRKAGLGLLLSKKSYSRAIAFIEDLSIAPEHIAEFMREFLDLLKNYKKTAGIYGHIGSGCMHIRPYIDLRNPEELVLMKRIMIDVAQLVKKHGGAMSGEHGDGMIRTWLNESFFGKNLYKAFCEVKEAFDPANRLNPGKIVHGHEVTENLRIDPHTPINKIDTFLDFSNEGGFELAADLCNGNGQCRKTEGVMCPSFQASGNEYDSTRARAQSLRALIHGRIDKNQWGGQEIYNVLDLCIECKGCKRECPSQVDMAKMKSEFLYAYQNKHGFSLRSRLFAHVSFMNRLGSFWPSAFNYLSESLFGRMCKKILKITVKRPLPSLSHQTFSSWFSSWKQTESKNVVVLFVDTYTQYNEPEIGIAACSIFADLGLHVKIIDQGCCGRPLISKGFLKDAKKYAQRLIDKMYEYAESNIPIVILEPSCFSSFKDDYKGLLGYENTKLQTVEKNCFSFEEFLCLFIKEGILPIKTNLAGSEVLLHTHCHQKALVGSQTTIKVLHAIPGLTVKEIPSGCCGLAGSFGYETEHYDFSMKIGELKLFPTVRQANSVTYIIASGMSCRSQIEQGTGRKPLHLAQLLSLQS